VIQTVVTNDGRKGRDCVGVVGKGDSLESTQNDTCDDGEKEIQSSEPCQSNSGVLGFKEAAGSRSASKEKGPLLTRMLIFVTERVRLKTWRLLSVHILRCPSKKWQANGASS
jgi:hypothetical protein